MALCRLFFFVGEPILLGGRLLLLLLNGSFYLSLGNGFVGLILFLVYVGGTIVLFTYCLILSPLQFFSKQKKYYRLIVIVVGISYFINTYMGVYELLPEWSFGDNWDDFICSNIKSGGIGRFLARFLACGVLVIIGMILFVVILRVVELVDFSRGS